MPSEPAGRLGYARSVALTREAFAGAPITVRLHTLGRLLSCPFLRTLDRLPIGGTVLDVGGGHGLFARLAIESGVRRVTIVEPDVEKLFVSASHPALDGIGGYLDAVRGSFDAVTMYDVLYRIPIESRNELFESLAQRVSPGGVLLIKELDPTSRFKFAWNRVQEMISDHALRLTLGSGLHYETPAEVMERMRSAGFRDLEAVRIDRWYPHSHILYLGRR